MNTKFIKITLCIGLLMVLTACASTGHSSNELMAEGIARDVPLLIYDTSWNSGVITTPLAVSLINTGHSQINSVSLTVAACPLNTNVPDTYRVMLIGPFIPARAYIVHAVPQVTSTSPKQVMELVHRYMNGFIIQAIGITDASGKETIYSDNVFRFLTGNISNYCRAH